MSENPLDELSDQINRAVNAVEDLGYSEVGAREMALVRTKLQEAALWLREALTIKMIAGTYRPLKPEEQGESNV